jgi:hypothetical protein
MARRSDDAGHRTALNRGGRQCPRIEREARSSRLTGFLQPLLAQSGDRQARRGEYALVEIWTTQRTD